VPLPLGNRNPAQMIRVVDRLAQAVVSHGVTHVFGVTGGAAVHIFDAFSNLLPKENILFFHHEQHAGYAAEAYSRLSEKSALLVVTSGPGGTNAITPVVSAWIDSVPLLVLSGQSRSDQLKKDNQTRQMGSQEVSISSLVSEHTQWFGQLTSLESADEVIAEWLHATSREKRSGPSWLDFPLDIQLSKILSAPLPSNEARMKQFQVDEGFSQVGELLSECERPILAIGAGARLGGLSTKAIQNIVAKLDVPSVATWNAVDSIDPSKTLFLGVFGVMGQRSANLALREADLVLGIGTHFGGQLTGPKRDLFSDDATVLTLNPDESETLVRFPGAINFPLPASRWPSFFDWASGLVDQNTEWRRRARELRELRYERSELSKNDVYSTLDLFFSQDLQNSAIVVDGGGTVTQIAFHCFKYQANVRCFTASGLGAMGSGMPESIGASQVEGFSQIFCLVGDGSYMTNLSALANAGNSRIPIKILVMNNEGYASIRNTQSSFLQKRFLGSTLPGGLPMISIVESAKAFGLSCNVLDLRKDRVHAAQQMAKFVNSQKSELLVALLDPEQTIIPRTRFIENEDGTSRAAPVFDMDPPLVDGMPGSEHAAGAKYIRPEVNWNDTDHTKRNKSSLDSKSFPSVKQVL